MPARNTDLTREIKQEIGQHFIPGFIGHEVTEEVISLIRDYHVGAIIVMKRNVKDIPHLRKLISALQAVAKEAGHAQPLLIGIDQENGLVSAFSTLAHEGGTQLFAESKNSRYLVNPYSHSASPGAMALAATGTPDLAELVNASTGREMHLAGINWAFSPVCDINSDPRNPVIGVRSFGDDPLKVAQFSTAAARGLTSAGIAPSPKHFPGHGDTHVDSHIGLPRILKTKAQLEATEIVPFKQLVREGVATVMTGHMALPFVVGDDTPCSLSRIITTDLLRAELGFEGVIVTDCLEMDAVATAYGTEQGAVKALQAGADVAMICHRLDRQKGAIEATYEAVKSGTLSLDELRKSGNRIRALKERFAGSWEEVLRSDLDMGRLKELKSTSASVSKDVYSHSITVLRDEKHIIPLKIASEAPLFVLTPAMETLNRAVDDAENIIRTADGKLRNTAGPSYTAFAASVSQRAGTPVTHIVYGADDTPPASFGDAAAIIYATRNADRSTWQLDYLRAILEVAGDARVIMLATLTPYEILESVAGRDAAYMCSFEFTHAALDAASAVVFGEVQASGQLPVTKRNESASG